MDIIVVYAAPIPVGHRVTVTWHVLEEPGLGGQTRTDERPHQPWITDLDTGVEYRTDWAVGADRRKYADKPYTLGDQLVDGVAVQREVTGTVRSCQVVTVRGFPELEIQTHLSIDLIDRSVG